MCIDKMLCRYWWMSNVFIKILLFLFYFNGTFWQKIFNGTFWPDTYVWKKIRTWFWKNNYFHSENWPWGCSFAWIPQASPCWRTFSNSLWAFCMDNNNDWSMTFFWSMTNVWLSLIPRNNYCDLAESFLHILLDKNFVVLQTHAGVWKSICVKFQEQFETKNVYSENTQACFFFQLFGKCEGIFEFGNWIV